MRIGVQQYIDRKKEAKKTKPEILRKHGTLTRAATGAEAF
jgi:hypothetical protein